jgi:hypothetical protein
MNYLPELVSYLHPADLCLLSREDYRSEPPVSGLMYIFSATPIQIHDDFLKNVKTLLQYFYGKINFKN